MGVKRSPLSLPPSPSLLNKLTKHDELWTMQSSFITVSPPRGTETGCRTMPTFERSHAMPVGSPRNRDRRAHLVRLDMYATMQSFVSTLLRVHSFDCLRVRQLAVVSTRLTRNASTSILLSSALTLKSAVATYLKLYLYLTYIKIRHETLRRSQKRH